MASGGGATSSADMVQHQKVSHGLILMGIDPVTASPNNTWALSPLIDVDDYSSSPSVLSFLINEGLTAAGGNPFEGTSGFDPDDALAAMEDAINAFETEVNSLSDIGDWSGFLSVARAGADSQFSGIDVESVFNGVVTDAITHALSGVSSAWSSARIAGEEIADAVSAKAISQADSAYEDAKGSAETLATTAIANRRADASDDMAAADTAFSNISATVADDIETLSEAAASKARSETSDAIMEAEAGAKALAEEIIAASRNDVVSDMAAAEVAAGTIRTNSASNISTVIDAAITKAVEEAGAISGDDSTMALSMNSTASQAKDNMSEILAQATGDSVTDAAAVITNVEGNIVGAEDSGEVAGDTVYNAAEQDSVSAMTSLSAAKQAVIMAASDIDGTIEPIAASRLDTAKAEAVAEGELATAVIVNNASSAANVVSDTMYSNAEDNSEAFLTSSNDVVPTNLTTLQAASEEDAESTASALEPAARSAALSATDQAVELAESSSTSVAADGESGLRTQALTGMAAIINAIDPQVSGVMAEAIGNSLQHAANGLHIAMQSALESVDSNMLDSLVSAYRRRQLRTHLRSVNRFAGGMADINAVNSSTFIIGMALLESDFEQGVRDFEIQTTIQLSQAGLAHFGQVFVSVSQEYLRTHQARFANYVEAYQLSGGTYEKLLISSIPTFLQTYVSGIGQYMQVAGLAYGESMRAGTGLTQIQASIADSSLKTRAQIVGQLAQIQLQAYVQTLVSQLETRTGLTEVVTRNMGALSGIQADLIGRITAARQSLVSDLIRLYGSAYDAGVSGSMNTAGSMAQEGLRVSQGSGSSKATIAQELIKNYLQTYTAILSQGNQTAGVFGGIGESRERILDAGRKDRVDLIRGTAESYVAGYTNLIGQENQTAGVFGSLGDARLKVLADTMDKKLTTYVQGMGIGLQAFDRRVAEQLQVMERSILSHFDGRIKTYLSDSNERSTFVRDGVGTLQAAQALRMSARHSLMAADTDLESKRIVASVDQFDRDIELDVKSATWDMELFQGAGNVLSAVTGSVVQNAMKPSKSSSAIAGMASGASGLLGGAKGAGLKVATTAGGLSGLGIGALAIGAVAGGLAGALQ